MSFIKAVDGSSPIISANWSAQAIKVTPKAENIFCDGSLAYVPITANLSCKASDDGLIFGTASGGNAPYNYSWSNGATSNSLNNLSPDSYHLTLTDNFSCVHTQSYTVTEPSSNINATEFITLVSNASNSNGAIDLT